MSQPEAEQRLVIKVVHSVGDEAGNLIVRGSGAEGAVNIQLPGACATLLMSFLAEAIGRLKTEYDGLSYHFQTTGYQIDATPNPTEVMLTLKILPDDTEVKFVIPRRVLKDLGFEMVLAAETTTQPTGSVQ